ncbi:MAG: AmmeMemoRadiSam system protein B [Deltaproteobacteria bacterium]|nr:AmmeMemoRadiSam system protein B [Deltaproteobacteria bacterium]
MSVEKPKLREDLQPVRASMDGRDVILLRDPLALSSQVLALGTGTVGLLGLLDGTHDVPELRLLAIRAGGGSLEAGDHLENLLGILDERCLLENDHYREARRAIIDDWNAQTDRPAAFSGAAYPGEGSELSRFLEEILVNAPEPRRQLSDGRLVGIMAPHIDIQKGWPLYGAAYETLRRSATEPDRILLLGTGHTMDEGLLCPTTKHYATPLGRTSTDVDLAIALSGACGGAVDDLPHKGEHSIEFQVIFLQHVFAEKIPPLVPVLCGGASSLLARASRPSGLPGVDGALELMREAVGGAGLVVAGVDLVHVGPKFGDADPASSILPDALEHESALLDALESADAEAFWSEAAKVEDRYNVCGLSSLGVLLETLPEGSSGVLLGRDVMREHDTNSAVGFASMAFFAR